MSGTLSDPKTKWRLSMTLLKWVAIVLPILFLASVDILRHTVFYRQLHTRAGFFVIYGVISLAVVAFSFVIFGFMGKLQRRILGQNRQLSALNSIAVSAASELRLQELLDTSLDLVLAKFDAEAGLVCLVDLEREEHSAVCHRGLSEDAVRRLQRAKLRDDPVAQKVVSSGHPVIFTQVFEDPRVVEALRKAGIKAGISAPLKSEGEVNGILAIATRQERHFSDTDKEFLEGIGGQLGMAIRNAVLYEKANLQNRELSALITVGRSVTSARDLDELLQSSLDTIVDVTSADAAEIWLLEGDDELALRCHRGEYRDAFFERTRLRLGEGIPGLVGQSGESIITHDLASDARFVRQAATRAGFRTFYALPLVYQTKLLAVLAVAAISPDALKAQWEVRLLNSVGEWLALSIENMRLHYQVQDLAVVRERERIAREIHDGMAQLLGYINTQTIALKKLLADQQLEQARTELTKIEDIARDLYADVREQILGLRTTGHSDESFLPALREYAARYTDMSGVLVEFKGTFDLSHLHLAAASEIQILHIVQEALTNVRKHARASTASISFEEVGDELVVIIGDNGRGFDQARLPSTGWPRFGLQTMRERAESVGGTLSIASEPGHGTKIELRIPRSQSENKALVR